MTNELNLIALRAEEKKKPSQSYQEGFAAGRQGASVKECPPDQDHPFSSWLTGFHEGVSQWIKDLPAPSESGRAHPARMEGM